LAMGWPGQYSLGRCGNQRLRGSSSSLETNCFEAGSSRSVSICAMEGCRVGRE
jgi:hypothetical protein